jgi:hypothetical protein
MKARDIELAIANYFGYRTNTIVPNVFWGMGLNHEADILMLSKAGYVTEIEIKISKADILKDKKKRHQHQSDIVKAFFFAVPEQLTEYALANIPEEAGLLIVKDTGTKLRVEKKRDPKPRPRSRPFTESQRFQLARLGLMRYWSVRDHVQLSQNQVLGHDYRCGCGFSKSMTGDGCRYCQPQEYIDRLLDQIKEIGKEDTNA